MSVLLLLALAALAADHRVVTTGDTVESLATAAGAEEWIDEIRQRNGLGPGEQPLVGTVLVIPTDDPDVARVLGVTGQGDVTLPGASSTVPLVPWLDLPPGAVVCTDEHSFASVRLAAVDECHEHDDVSLLEGTCLTVRGARARPGARTSHVFLSSGSVAVLHKGVSPGELAVETPSGTTLSRRGGVRVTIEEKAARTESLAGDVSVMGAGVEVQLGVNQGSRVRTGQAPSDPVDLLGPGQPVNPGPGAPLIRPDFTWTPVERALGYRVELATSPDFRDLVRRQDVGEPRWSPDHLFLPFRRPGLWWRVSSFDRTGFQGPPSEPLQLSFPAGVGP